MACEVKINGKPSAIMTEIFQYLEDNDRTTRSPQDIYTIMENYGVVKFFPEQSQFVAEKDMEETLSDINKAVQGLLETDLPILVFRDRGKYLQVEVDMNSLNQIPMPNPNNPGTHVGEEDVTQESTEEEQELDEEEDNVEGGKQGEDTAGKNLEKEAFAMKDDLDYVTEQIVVNLDKQIERLERLAIDSPKANEYVREMELLRRQMRKVKKGKEKLDDYIDFILYAGRVADRSQVLVDKIRQEYAGTWKTQSPEERAKTLRKMVELQETLNAFYSKDEENSLLNMLARKIRNTPGNISEDAADMLAAIDETNNTMGLINKAYMDTIIPILGDYLLSFAPMDVNKELDEKIAAIKENKRLIGYSRLDRRHKRSLSFQEKLDLNVLQLQEKKLTRQKIIDELRETHKDVSMFSLYLDPLVHSSDVTLQLFGMSMKDLEVTSYEQSLQDKYEMGQAFAAFKAANSASEDNPANFYRDVIEKVTLSRRGKDGKYELQEVMSFVQPFNVTKFYKNQHAAFQKARKRWSMPEDPSELDNWFESDQGKGYLNETAQWYRDNTEKIDDADRLFQDMLERQRELEIEIQAARNAGDEMKLQMLYLDKNAVDDDIERSRGYVMDETGSRTMVYKGLLVQPKAKLYENPKFKEMPPYAREFYNTAISIYNKSQRKVGRSALYVNRWQEDNFSYVLPSIRISGYDQMQETGAGKTLKNLGQDWFTTQETDTEYGELLRANGEKTKFIPRYFTNTIDAGLVSKDVATSVIKFADMANRYESKAKMTGVVNAMQSAIGDRKVKFMTSSGNIRLDRIAQKFGYQLEPFEAKDMDGKDSNAFKQLMSFVDNVYYGRSNIQSQEDDAIMGGLSKAKMAMAARTFTAFSSLSLNTLQATNQIILDHTMGNQEAWAEQFYSKENAAYATRMTYKIGNMMGALKDTPKFMKANKVASFLEWADAMQHFGGAFGGETGTAFKKAFSLDGAFFLQHGAEYQTTAVRTLALADSYRGKLKDKKGNVIQVNGRDANLFDVMIRNKQGRLVVDPKVANFNKTEYVAKLHGLLKRTNQLKGRFDTPLANRSNLGKMLMLFKNYFEPGYRKRLGHGAGGAHTDMELGAVTEGYYATMFNLVSSAVQNKNLASTFAGLTAGEKQNVRRTVQDMVVIAAITALQAVVSGIKDDDDESYAADFATYQLLRLRAEVAQFLNPITYSSMVTDPTAVANPVRHLYDFIGQSFTEGAYVIGLADEEDIYYQRRTGLFEKGDRKWLKEFYDVMPGARGIFKSRDPESAAKWFLLNM